MKIEKFGQFIEEGIVKKQIPDKSRATFLIKESERRLNSLNEKIEKIRIKDENANDYVENCYDILMVLVRAKMLTEGYNASGFDAHKAEVAYLTVLGFSEADIQFADQMRVFRNGMLYYGKRLDKTYAEKTIEFTKKIYAELMKTFR